MLDPTQPISLPAGGALSKATASVVTRLNLGWEKSGVSLAEYQDVVKTDLPGLAQLCFLQWDRLIGSNDKQLRFDPDANNYERTRERVILGLRAALHLFTPEVKSPLFPFVASVSRCALWADIQELRRSFGAPPAIAGSAFIGAQAFERARCFVLARQGRSSHLSEIFTLTQSQGVKTAELAPRLGISATTLSNGIERIRTLLQEMRQAPPAELGSEPQPPPVDGRLPPAAVDSFNVPEEFRELFRQTGVTLPRTIAFHPTLREGALERAQAGLRHAFTLANTQGLVGADRINLAKRAMLAALWAPNVPPNDTALSSTELLGERELNAVAARIQAETSRDARMRGWKDLFLQFYRDGVSRENLAEQHGASVDAIGQRLYRIQNLVRAFPLTTPTASPEPTTDAGRKRESNPHDPAPRALAAREDLAARILHEEEARARQRFMNPPEFAQRIGHIIRTALAHATSLATARGVAEERREAYLRRAARLAPWAYLAPGSEARPLPKDSLLGESEVATIRQALGEKERSDLRLKDWQTTFDRYFLEGLSVPGMAESLGVLSASLYVRISNIRKFAESVCVLRAKTEDIPPQKPAPTAGPAQRSASQNPADGRGSAATPQAQEPTLREAFQRLAKQHSDLVQLQQEAFEALRRAATTADTSEATPRHEELAELNRLIDEKLSEILRLLDRVPASTHPSAGG